MSEASALNGLVDNRRAAAMLGIPVNTFKVWASRARGAKSGIAAAMPAPVGTMHGNVYRVEDIEEFGRQIALKERGARTVERKEGRYFTPNAAAELMAAWAIRDPGEVIVEPSLGDGQFADAAKRVSAQRGWSNLELHACELDPATAASAVERGAIDARFLHVGDFLKQGDLPAADVVIGNPPYVRVRELKPPLRSSAHRAAKVAMGQEMDPAGSVWMPFVAKASKLLRPGGRLAFVLPLDFTYVRYARPLWTFLAESFGSLTVLRFRERVFPDILQNVLILLADERGGRTDHVRHIAADSLSALPDGELGPGTPIPIAGVAAGERLFQHALLPDATRHALAALQAHSTPAVSRVKFSVGYVSGNKKFFHPSPQAIRTYRLPTGSLIPTVESSRQLTGGALGTASLDPSAHLWLPGDRLTAGERRYVTAGEADGVDMAYKCRIRQPWYRVPGVRTPDLVLTAFSDRPRLYLNDAGWVASNSVLAGTVTSGEEPRRVAHSWYTPLTLLSTELQIHSLGGGVMIAVPREADSVQILRAEATLAPDAGALDRALQAGDADAAYGVGAESVERLIGAEGLAAIYEGTDVLTKWRKAER